MQLLIKEILNLSLKYLSLYYNINDILLLVYTVYYTVYYFYQFLFLFSQFNSIIFGKRNKMERFFLKFMSYLSKKKKKKRFIFINRVIVPWIFPSSQKRKDFTYEYKEEEGEEKETWYKIKRFFNVYAI